MGSTSEIRALVFYYLNGLLARRWTILIAAWIVCVIGWFIIAMLPNSYTSTARIYVDTQSLLRPLMKDLAVQPDIERQVDIMRRTLLTRPNIEQIIRRTDLDLTVSTPLELERLVERLSKQIAIKIEGPNLFNIEYSSRSPELARRIVDTTLQTFVEMNLGSARQDMESAQRFIDQQIAEYETNLRNAELRVAEYKRENIGQLTNTERVERELNDVVRELSNLQSTLKSAIWQRDQLQLQLASTPKFSESQRTAVGGGARARISAELEEQRNQLARLLTQYTDRHPDVISQRSLIAQTEERLRSTPGATYTDEQTPNPTWEQLNLELQRAELGISTLETRIAQQQETIERLTTRITEIPEAQAELISLTRDYEVMLRQYERLIERRESARMAQRMGAESDNIEFRIIEPPIAPVEPSGPPRVLMMAAVLLIGLGIGGGLAFLRILMTDAFMNAKQLSDAIGLPVIGTLSVARSVLGGPGRVLEATMAACVALFLIGSFVGLSYIYSATASPPEFRTVVQGVTDAVLQRFGRAI